MAAWVAEGVVNYLGVSDDVRAQIATADCIVLPSYREGTPRTLLEAAAMARPIITTDAVGCREVPYCFACWLCAACTVWQEYCTDGSGHYQAHWH